MKRSKLHRLLVPVLLLIWLGTPHALAQITTGGITGRVVDDKGEPFPGVLGVCNSGRSCGIAAVSRDRSWRGPSPTA